MAKKLKSSCCKKYRKKGKACSRCPLMAKLAPPERLALLRRAKKMRKKTKRAKKSDQQKGG